MKKKAAKVVKNCATCSLATWKTTKTGAKHPSGDGECGAKYVLPTLPPSMKWLGPTPKPDTIAINRKNPFKKRCNYWVA